MKNRKKIMPDKATLEKSNEELADEALDAVAGGKTVVITTGEPCTSCGRYDCICLKKEYSKM